MNYKIWNKTDKINNIDAQHFINNLKIQDNDGVFLIINNENKVQSIEIDRIVKGIYNLDTSLTTEQVAQEYLRLKALEEEKAKQEQITLEEQAIKISILEEEQAVQNDEILTSMLATSDLFEIVLNMSGPATMNIQENNKNTGGNNMVELYVTLILKGVKTIDQVPAIIRDQVQAQLDLVTK